MKRFYLTFGQKNTALRNGWIEVEAETREEAIELAHQSFGVYWADMYEEEDFKSDVTRRIAPIKMFPLGKIGETLK
jgi:hypothetical protein